MFARGLVSLHTPPLLGRKPSSVKSRVSISSKLIEIKGLQLHYFGHLRKTGGRGSYRLVHTTFHGKPARLRRRPLHKHGIGECPPSPVTSHQSLLASLPLSVTSLQYPAAIAQDIAKTEPSGIPAWPGSPRCGYVPFANRCPDAHD